MGDLAHYGESVDAKATKLLEAAKVEISNLRADLARKEEIVRLAQNWHEAEKEYRRVGGVNGTVIPAREKLFAALEKK
jgi:hypothetical protein